MLNQNLVDFYNNWNAKANNIVDDNLENVFDRYITLFVVYNFLYNQVPPALLERGENIPRQIFDNKAATDLVVQYLGAANILSNLHNNNNDQDIQCVINLIDQQTFYIKLKFGQRQRKEDIKILNALTSGNDVDKATALLQVCYYVRCNLFHGSKDFVEDQRLLLEPLTRIIKTILIQLFAELLN